MADLVEIFEVGPRDGLQNEAAAVTTADKIHLTNLLSNCGFRRIEIGSFVSPKWVPKMADSVDVFAGIDRVSGISYAALTPNMQGFDGAVRAKADEIAIFASASEGFSKANINCTIDESLDRFAPVSEAANAAGIPMRGYVSCVTDCPYDGAVEPSAVARVVRALLDMGAYEVSLGDTVGQGTPESVQAMLEAVLQVAEPGQLAGHFHDTGGQALNNIETSIGLGLRVFDSSIAGLGGCPYAPGASGNVATENVINMLNEKGFETGLDLEKINQASDYAKKITHA